MESNALAGALVAMSIAAAGPAFAQQDNQENLDRNFEQIQRLQEWQSRHGGYQPPPGMRVYPAPGQPPYVQPGRPGYQQPGRPGDDRRGDGRSHGDRGAGPDHALYPGMYLPPQYRHHSYVVSDWRGHHLSAPPPGYDWVQTGGDYVLVATATGLIVQLLLMNS